MAAYLYPVALDVSGKTCVIVGGGAVGARKAAALVEAGAFVRVVAPVIGDGKLRELIAAGNVSYTEAVFNPAHLDGAFLAIAATNLPAVNAQVRDAARARGVLLNLAAPAQSAGDDEGDFATMATIRRGDLLITLTTGGAGPALSARLRRELAAQFGPEWEPYVALLREMRNLAKNRYPDETERTAALRRLADCDAVREHLADADAAGALREALACL